MNGKRGMMGDKRADVLAVGTGVDHCCLVGANDVDVRQEVMRWRW